MKGLWFFISDLGTSDILISWDFFVARSHSRVRKVITKLAILSSGLCLSVCLSEGLGVFLRSTETSFVPRAQKPSFVLRSTKDQFLFQAYQDGNDLGL